LDYLVFWLAAFGMAHHEGYSSWLRSVAFFRPFASFSYRLPWAEFGPGRLGLGPQGTPQAFKNSPALENPVRFGCLYRRFSYSGSPRSLPGLGLICKILKIGTPAITRHNNRETVP
jgi:hypothetical protein